MKNSSLEVEKYDFRVNTMRSRRLPHFQFSVLGGQLLHSFDYTFPAGCLALIRVRVLSPQPTRR